MSDTIPPVDRTQRELTTGVPVLDDSHKKLGANGQQESYVVLTAEERAKGFVRPVRTSYIHSGVKGEFYKDSHVLIKPGYGADGKRRACGHRTTIGIALAETYARDPEFYSGTFCVSCGAHYPVGPDGEFVWEGDGTKVGS